MKLDDRIIDRKYIFDCFTSDKAKQFIGEKGYFAGDLCCFKDLLQLCAYGILVNVFDDSDDTFQKGSFLYRYFIPNCYLKSKENKFRPYTLTEFKNKFPDGQSIMFRKKGEEGCEVYSLLGGYRHEQFKDQTITYIYIGFRTYTLDELFNEYEWYNDDTQDWNPFGVEE